MATLIRGLLAFNLDWQYVMVGAALAATVELCGVGSLSFAVGAYLPLSTTSPVFVGGLVPRAGRRGGPAARRAGRRPRRGARPRQPVRDGAGRRRRRGRRRRGAAHRHRRGARAVGRLSVEAALTRALGAGGYQLLGLAVFGAMAALLWRIAPAPAIQRLTRSRRSVRLARFELATPGFVGRCSIQMSYSRVILKRHVCRARRRTSSASCSGSSLARARAFLYGAPAVQTAWRGGREAEGGGLLNRYTAQKLYRGFESLPLR